MFQLQTKIKIDSNNFQLNYAHNNIINPNDPDPAMMNNILVLYQNIMDLI